MFAYFQCGKYLGDFLCSPHWLKCNVPRDSPGDCTESPSLSHGDIYSHHSLSSKYFLYPYNEQSLRAVGDRQQEQCKPFALYSCEEIGGKSSFAQWHIVKEKYKWLCTGGQLQGTPSGSSCSHSGEGWAGPIQYLLLNDAAEASFLWARTQTCCGLAQYTHWLFFFIDVIPWGLWEGECVCVSLSVHVSAHHSHGWERKQTKNQK